MDVVLQGHLDSGRLKGTSQARRRQLRASSGGSSDATSKASFPLHNTEARQHQGNLDVTSDVVLSCCCCCCCCCPSAGAEDSDWLKKCTIACKIKSNIFVQTFRQFLPMSPTKPKQNSNGADFPMPGLGFKSTFFEFQSQTSMRGRTQGERSFSSLSGSWKGRIATVVCNTLKNIV